MFFKKNLLVAALLTFGAVSGAQAATIQWATSVIDSRNGAADVATNTGNRAIPGNAIGAPDGNFFSIGLGKTAVFAFDTLFGGQGTLVEVTNGSRAQHVEQVQVLVGTSYTAGSFDLSSFILAGTFTNTNQTTTFTLPSGQFAFLALRDVSEVRNGRDGWDVGAVGVTPALSAVPLPASGLLLIGALGGLAILRRRRKAV